MKYKDLSITWRGDVTSYSSIAQYSRGILEPLIKGGASVRLELTRPSSPEAVLSEWWVENFKSLTKAQPGKTTIVAGQVGNITIKSNENVVFIPDWHTKEFPLALSGILKRSQIQKFIVPNLEMKKSLEKVTDKSVKEVYPLIDVDSLNLVKPLEINGVNHNTVLFGFIGEWNNKNNISDLVISYFKTFTDKDNVALVLKTFNGSHGDLNERKKLSALIKKIKSDCKKPNLPPVILLQETMSYETILSLMKRINIYISSSRGESFGLDLISTMAMGKQVIACDHSLMRTYFEKETFNLKKIDFSYEPVTLDNKFYNISDDWARMNMESLSKNMKDAFMAYLFNQSEIKQSSKEVKKIIRSINSENQMNKLFEFLNNTYQVPQVTL